MGTWTRHVFPRCDAGIGGQQPRAFDLNDHPRPIAEESRESWSCSKHCLNRLLWFDVHNEPLVYSLCDLSEFFEFLWGRFALVPSSKDFA